MFKETDSLVAARVTGDSASWTIDTSYYLFRYCHPSSILVWEHEPNQELNDRGSIDTN